MATFNNVTPNEMIGASYTICSWDHVLSSLQLIFGSVMFFLFASYIV